MRLLRWWLTRSGWSVSVFDLNAYETVAERLANWLGTTEDTAVITHMISAPGADICVFKASLYAGGKIVATGHAEEVRGQGNVNRTSHVENCETSAVGRALANLGMAGSDPAKRPSREEMAKVQRASTSNPGAPTVRVMSGGASEKQIGYIKGACKRAGVVPPPWVDQLTKQDASQFIEAEKNGEPVAAILARMADEEPF